MATAAEEKKAADEKAAADAAAAKEAADKAAADAEKAADKAAADAEKAAASKKLTCYVSVDGTQYGPDSKLTAEIVGKISNPDVWA